MFEMGLFIYKNTLPNPAQEMDLGNVLKLNASQIVLPDFVEKSIHTYMGKFCTENISLVNLNEWHKDGPSTIIGEDSSYVLILPLWMKCRTFLQYKQDGKVRSIERKSGQLMIFDTNMEHRVVYETSLNKTTKSQDIVTFTMYAKMTKDFDKNFNWELFKQIA